MSGWRGRFFLNETPKEDIVKGKDLSGRFDLRLIRSFCTLNTHTQEGKANTMPEKSPDKQAKGLVVRWKPFQSFKKC